jgi:hypothetical protein
MIRLFALLLSAFFLPATAGAQSEKYNFDESKVPNYKLPDPLVTLDGRRVINARMWSEVRRPEILNLFETQVYGKTPATLKSMRFEVESVEKWALGGMAVRKQVTVLFNGRQDGPKMSILIYLPAGRNKAVPMFAALNFEGNHTIRKEPGIALNRNWIRQPQKDVGIVDNHATEAARGSAANRWAVEMILKRGYGLATMYYGDIDPDFDDGFQNGVHPLFYKPGQTKPKPDEWGSIAAWAWGLSRAMDYFETDNDIDARRVAVMGHSRLGKTSLWAGARDTRFAMVISNNSGSGGAALSRRHFGETIKLTNTGRPHWFCDNFLQYNDNEDAMPVDQHMLIALIAPRPVYIASAVEDVWADPRGEFVSALHADPVYRLLGTSGLPVKEMPGLNEPVMGTIGYHIRTGGHGVTDYDWEQYLTFADKHLRK